MLVLKNKQMLTDEYVLQESEMPFYLVVTFIRAGGDIIPWWEWKQQRLGGREAGVKILQSSYPSHCSAVRTNPSRIYARRAIGDNAVHLDSTSELPAA
jgi:hypothetical protein